MTNDPKATFLRETLNDQGRSQRWLGRQTGTSESMVSKYLNGRKRMPDEWFRQSVEVLGCPSSVLSFFDLNVPDGTSQVPVGDSVHSQAEFAKA